MKHHAGQKSGGPSLHQRILSELTEQVVSGAWPPGHRIPFEEELAARYGCSRMTVNKALTQLAAAGLLERRRRSGTFVRMPRTQSAILEIHDVRAEVEALGAPYGYRLLAREVRKTTDADRARLGTETAGELVTLTCLHLAGKTPFCHEDRLISLDAVPEAIAEPFDAEAPGPWLVRRVPWTVAEHRIGAADADPEVAGPLALKPPSAVLEIERTTWFAERVVTHVRFSYPAGRHTLVARFTPAPPVSS
jgi:GntR family histidine utilization transcriptional repressor